MVKQAYACPVFELSKWYADAVSAEGDFLIGYRARLRYRRFSVHYSSVLDREGQRHSLRASSLRLTAADIRWQAPALGVDASWQRGSGEIRKVLYRDARGAVEWHCLVPQGAATIGRLAGLGYVEHLRLTIPPWRLPIHRLRWGHFLSARHSLIWIDWQGEVNVRAVFYDGQPVEAVEIDDSALVLADGTRASFDRGLVVRDGALGATVLGAVPGLGRIAPRMFAVEECKWRSRALLHRAAEPEDCGWCLHEVVTWP